MSTLKIVSSPSNERVFTNIKRLPNSFKAGVHEAYIEIGKYLKRTIKKDLNDEKHGIIYIKRLRGRLVRHHASAPGEPPATFTGDLERTISTKTSGYRDLNLSAGGGRVDYARSLEFGSSGVAKRPYLSKSIRDNERNTIESFYKNISKRINK